MSETISKSPESAPDGRAAPPSREAEIARLAARLSLPHSPVRKRWHRTAVWLLMVVAIAGGMYLWQSTRPTPVELATVSYQRVGPVAHPLLRHSGIVRYAREATVGTSMRTPVRSIHFDEGEYVRRGALLAQLDHAELTAQEVLQQIETADAEATLARTRLLHEGGAASDATLQQAETALQRAQAALNLTRTQVAAARVYAPFDGVVTRRLADLGEIPAQGICVVMDVSRTLVEVDVSQEDIALLGSDQPAVVTLNAYPAIEYAAELFQISAEADQAKNSITVQVEVLAPDDRFKAQMSAIVYFVDQVEPGNRAVAATLAVDTSAVMRGDDEVHVWVVEQGRTRETAITTGRPLEDRIEILGGLQENDQVVSGLQRFDLREGDRVRAATLR